MFLFLFVLRYSTYTTLELLFYINSFEFLYGRGSQSSSGPASAGPHPPSGPAPFGLPANRSSAASLTEELRKTLESNYLDGGFSTGLPGSGGGQHKTSSREKVKSNLNLATEWVKFKISSWVYICYLIISFIVGGCSCRG